MENNILVLAYPKILKRTCN